MVYTEEGSEYSGQRMLNIELSGNTERGRPQRSLTKKFRRDRVRWRHMICCALRAAAEAILGILHNRLFTLVNVVCHILCENSLPS